MKKVISCMICALLLVGCMAGCGSTGGKSGSGNGIKIMMSLSQGDDFRNTIVEQAKGWFPGESGGTYQTGSKRKIRCDFMWTG